MIDEIATSKVKMKLLGLFAEGSSFTVSDASRRAKVSKSRASECLRELSTKGILESRVVGRSVVYSLSKTALAKRVVESLNEGKRLLEDIIRDFIKQAKGEKPLSMAVFGSSFQKIKLGSDIDFFVVSMERGCFYKIASDLTAKYGITISITIMPIEEFRRKAKMGEEFVINVLANHKLVYGKGLEELVWQGK